MKYIPADKLIAEIERQIKETKSMKPSFDQFWAGQISAFKGAIKIAESLQQEQPEVDFETELKNERTKLLDAFGPMNGEQCLAIRDFARYFYELGRTKKEE